MVVHHRKKMFQAKYRFTNILCYVPKRYGTLNHWQHIQRAVIDDFKNGHYDDALCQCFEQKIKAFITHEKNMTSWVITFVPPSIGYEVEYDWRYRHLAQYLHDHLPDVPVIYYGVSVKNEYSWKTKSKGGRRVITPGNLVVDQYAFREKSVILIDDVINTGYSFRTVGDALVAAGATAIHGVILAKTIHPHLPFKEIEGKNKNLQRKNNGSRAKVSQVKPRFTLPFPDVATPDQLRAYQAMVAIEANTNRPISENSNPNVKPQ